MVDPVDRNRNVAAALTLQRMSEFITAARNFLRSGKKEYFTGPEYASDPEAIMETCRMRGSKVILVSMGVPDIPADACTPSSGRPWTPCSGDWRRRGFRVLNADYWSDEGKGLLL